MYATMNGTHINLYLDINREVWTWHSILSIASANSMNIYVDI